MVQICYIVLKRTQLTNWNGKKSDKKRLKTHSLQENFLKFSLITKITMCTRLALGVLAQKSELSDKNHFWCKMLVGLHFSIADAFFRARPRNLKFHMIPGILGLIVLIKLFDIYQAMIECS